jgi:hypothetical protein
MHQRKSRTLSYRITDCPMLCFYCQRPLLHVVVCFVVEYHALAEDLDRLQLFERDSLTALRADTAGEMIEFFAVR